MTSVAVPLWDSRLQWYGCGANKCKADAVTWLILSGWCGRLELEEGVDAKVDCEDGKLVGRLAPLKVVVGTNEKRGVCDALVYS